MPKIFRIKWYFTWIFVAKIISTEKPRNINRWKVIFFKYHPFEARTRKRGKFKQWCERLSSDLKISSRVLSSWANTVPSHNKHFSHNKHIHFYPNKYVLIWRRGGFRKINSCQNPNLEIIFTREYIDFDFSYNRTYFILKILLQ